MHKKIAVLFVMFVLFLSGCASRAAFNYKTGDIVNANIKLPLKVAVLPFDDKRGENSTNAVLLYLIPLMPFGPIEYDRPETASMFMTHPGYNFRPSEDIAKAAVAELKQNRFFDEVFFSNREKEPGIDLIMTGEIHETSYKGKMITYGLSIEGPLLWFIGLPASYVNNSVEFSMELKRTSDGMIMWKHDVKKEWSKTCGLYYDWSAEFDGYPLIIRDGLVEGMKDLSKEIAEKGPEAFRSVGLVKK